MKLKRIVTPHKLKNDCWNLVLAQATDKDYYVVRMNLEHLCASDGSLDHRTTHEYLTFHGYTAIELRRSEDFVSVSQVVSMFKTYKTVIASYDRRKGLAHLSFAHNYEHFTTSETDDSFTDPVFFIWVKLDNILK